MFSRRSSVIFILLLLIISPLKAHVDLQNPSGGEIFIPGQIVNIEWEEVLRHNSLNWDILFSKDGGVSWDTVKSNIPISTMNYAWELPYIVTQTGRIKVIQDNVEEDYEDVSEDFTISSVTGIDQQIEAERVKIYPNPISNLSYLEFDNPENYFHTLTLYNSRGQLVRIFKEIKTNRFQLDLKELSSGIYFYQLNSDKKLHSSGSLIVQ